MKNCNSFKKMFSEYIDNVLSTENRNRLQAHLASCSRCRSSLDEMTRIKTSLHSLAKIRTSEAFDAVMHARLVQQVRNENKRSNIWTPFFFFANLKTPAFVAAAVMFVFLGAALERYYGSAPQNSNFATQYQAAARAVAEKTNAENSGYMVVSPPDTANNTIVITNYPHLEELSPRRRVVQTRVQGIPVQSLPDLKNAPTRQGYNRPYSSGRTRPQIQFAKEYVF